jgi:hypothetical protein
VRQGLLVFIGLAAAAAAVHWTEQLVPEELVLVEEVHTQVQVMEEAQT